MLQQLCNLLFHYKIKIGMKKLFLAGAVAVSAVALAASTSRVPVKSTKMSAVYQDTVPGKKKKDTTSWPSDTTKTPPAFAVTGK